MVNQPDPSQDVPPGAPVPPETVWSGDPAGNAMMPSPQELGAPPEPAPDLPPPENQPAGPVNVTPPPPPATAPTPPSTPNAPTVAPTAPLPETQGNRPQATPGATIDAQAIVSALQAAGVDLQSFLNAVQAPDPLSQLRQELWDKMQKCEKCGKPDMLRIFSHDDGTPYCLCLRDGTEQEFVHPNPAGS